MMKYNIYSILFIFLFSAVNAGAKKDEPVNVFKNNPISYYLPHTEIVIEVLATKTYLRRGPLYLYSNRFLNVSDVIKINRDYWQVELVTIKPRATANNDLKYKLIDYGLNYTFSDDGRLLAVNKDVTPTLPIQPLGKMEILNAVDARDTSFNHIPYTGKQIMAGSTAAMAQQVAEMIYKIRDNRYSILTGEYEILPPDGDSYTITLEELNKMESEFMSLFTGKRKEVRHKFRIVFTPGGNNTGKQVAFRFSADKGVLPADDLSGSPFFIQVAPLQDIELEATAQRDTVRTGVYYTLPSAAMAEIFDGRNKIFEKEIKVIQLGAVKKIPATLVKQANVSLEFDPETGNLKKITHQK